MNDINNKFKQSALVMRVVGWGVLIGFPLAMLGYPPGFMWGSHPANLPVMVPHPESHLNALHPYVFMLVSLYIAWAILMVRGAKDTLEPTPLYSIGESLPTCCTRC